MPVVHLNDGGWSDKTRAYMVACARQGIDQPARVTRLKSLVTCLRCRGTVRFSRYMATPEGN